MAERRPRSRVSSLFSLGAPPLLPRKSEDGRRPSPPPLQVPRLRESRSAQHLSPSPDPSAPRAVSSGAQQPPDQLHTPLLPPPPIGGSFADRTTSSPRNSPRPVSYGDFRSRSRSRGASPARDLRPSTPDGRLTKKRSWIPGKSRTSSISSPPPQAAPAFVLTPQGDVPYDATYLANARPVHELWDERGSLLVYLFDTSRPSFKVDIAVVAASRGLAGLIQSSRSASPTEARPPSSGPESHLYLPLGLQPCPGEVPPDMLDRLVSVRNFFAFLVGQVLVGTRRLPTMFAVFMDIAESLHRFEFANMDGSTLGEAATASFLGYIQDLRLDDVRGSREKTMEALILAERMKCVRPLYNEAYVHGVGKWDELVRMQSPLFAQISPVTRKRMEKSAMDLSIRLQGVRSRLDTFDIPSLFAGVAAGSIFTKAIDTKAWRASFAGMRKWTINVYKHRYGAWPPKASSRKNDFEESGLNRILLKELYQDFCDLYDMLVDRSSLTTRSIDGAVHEVLAPDPAIHHLRQLLSEFDRSHPPVQPPVPYDVPLLPSLASTRRGFGSLPEKKQAKERTKKLAADEINMALMQSYNRDAFKVTPFLETFMSYERACANLKSAQEMIDLRMGQWIFLYVVLQSLPLLVVDAPGLRWTQGVEYFLCQVPRRSSPWTQQGDGSQQKAYYRVAGGAGVVSLPQDVVEFGIEATYQRSHCWEMAARWGGDAFFPSAPAPGTPLLAVPSDDHLPPPPSFGGHAAGSPSGSPRMSNRNSMALGLEALPLPPSIMADEFQNAGRKSSTPDPSKSFEAIIGPAAPVVKKKRWESLSG